MATELRAIRPHPVFIFLVCLLLFFLKSPDAVLYPQFWAEDGAIFYAQQFGKNWPQLTTPYAGYIHFIPRMIAWLAIPIKPLYVPLFYNVAAIIIDSLCVVYAFKYLSFMYGATAALISFFLLPTVGDIYGTMTNIQWFLQFSLVLSVLQPGANSETPPAPARMFVISALIIVACLTGPFCVIDCAVILSLFVITFLLNNHGASLHNIVPDKMIYALGEVKQSIQPFRLIALSIGALLQVSVMISQTVRTPNLEYALTIADRANFGLLDSQSLYVQTINHPLYWLHVVILLICILICLANTVIFFTTPSYKFGVTLILLAIGAAQPVFAYMKQHTPNTLTPVSHYYYFFGVICFCSFGLIVNKLLPQHQRSILIASCMILACVLGWKPQYLSRPFLIPMNWSRFAEEISAADHDVIVPLNPDWRADIRRARTYIE